MACIKKVEKTGLVAIAPNAPYMAVGTMAGAGAGDGSVDHCANIDVYKLDFTSDDVDLPLVATVQSPDRFNRICWSKPLQTGQFSLGLVAGGRTDGSISVWNPLMMSLEDKDAAVTARLIKHTRPVRGLDFSRVMPNMLASGGDEGEICVWDLNIESNLHTTLKGAEKEVSFVSWHSKFEHILASTSNNGSTDIWDLRQQKALTSILDLNKRSCSVLQWNPQHSTELIISSDDDDLPALRLWDLRNTIRPLKDFVGHSKGIIAMQWCTYDSSYLLTSSRDKRSFCWNTFNGEIVRELPSSINGNFDVNWYNKIPGVISVSSFDGTIELYNIEACGPYIAGDDSSGAHGSLIAPKWLQCPTGATFGFAGKYISYRSNPCSNKSEVYVHELVADFNLARRVREFESLTRDSEETSLKELCDKRAAESLSGDERETWRFLKLTFEEEEDPSSAIIFSHLGLLIPKTLSNSSSETLTLSSETARTIMSEDDIISEDDFLINFRQSDSLVTCSEYPTITLDETIENLLVIGDFKAAATLCIDANRLTDAAIISHIGDFKKAGVPFGGASLVKGVLDLLPATNDHSYRKIMQAVLGDDLVTLTNKRPLNRWKQTLALLLTFSQGGPLIQHLETLASKLLHAGKELEATFCYILSLNFERTVEIWFQKLKSNKDGTKSYDLLQDLMEKTLVLAISMKKQTIYSEVSKLIETYAEFLSSQGLLSAAMQYIKFFAYRESPQLTILKEKISYSAEIGVVSALSSYIKMNGENYILCYDAPGRAGIPNIARRICFGCPFLGTSEEELLSIHNSSAHPNIPICSRCNNVVTSGSDMHIIEVNGSLLNLLASWSDKQDERELGEHWKEHATRWNQSNNRFPFAGRDQVAASEQTADPVAMLE